MKQLDRAMEAKSAYTERYTPADCEGCVPQMKDMKDMSDRFMELIRWQQEIELRLINAIGSITGNLLKCSEFPQSESHRMSLNILEEITNTNLNLSSELKDLLQ